MKKNYLSKLLILGVFLVAAFNLNAQTQEELKKISGKYNQEKLTTLKNNFEQKAFSEKQQALTIAKQKGWKTKFTTSDGRLLELQRVVDGKPIYYTTFNVDAAKSTRTDHLNTGGSLGLNLMGQNMTAHVWDAGLARSSHQEYDGPGGNNRFSIGDGTTATHYHAAHVAGTIISSGVQANAKGMAPHANAVGYNWNSDKTEATTAAAAGMLVSNHSYGYATRNQNGQVQLPQYYFGGYIGESRDWDQIMFDAPNYLMVVAAGNDGNDNTANTNPTGGAGFDKLTGHSTAKNNLVVAAANDANIDSNGNLVSVTIASFSSEGPTDDFRIKPDIAGNGVGVYSTYESSNTAYNSISGTSMASPNVTGSILLLQEHHHNTQEVFMRAATLKGLVLHTADDAGANGPDAVFGWGLLNAKKATETITNKGNESKIEELTLISGQSYTITVDSDGVNPLLASISWTDRAGTANTGTVNLTTPALVNDLDIRVAKGGTTYYPYELTGATTNAQQDNNVDPYERVDVIGASGTYTITVTHKGTLVGGSQNYSLIVTGLSGTPVVCNATVPTGVNTATISGTGATIFWNVVPAASYDVRYRVVGTSSWTTNAVVGASTVLSGLTPLTQYEVQVRSKCSSGNSTYSSSTNFTTPEIQLNYCNSNGNSVVDEYIGRVQIESIDNATGASSSGYADYTSISTNLTKGSSTTITVTPTWTGTLYNEGYAVFIDYNKDGDFTDSGETVWTKAASKTTPVSGSFTIPTSAITGETRMRVSLKYNGVPTSCEVFSYGEVEDYTVNIIEEVEDTTPPTAPTNLVASNITETTANLSWSASTDNIEVTEYEIFSNGISAGIVTSTGANITDLTANTTYSYTVVAKDAAGNISSESNSVSFTTLGGGSTTILHEGFFESGWDGWSDGGVDCKRYSGPRSYEGSYSIRLRDNSGRRSAMTSSSFNLSSYDAVEVSFYFYSHSMENGEDFWLRYRNGSSWATVATWTRGTSFENGNYYSATVVLSSADYTLASNGKFRFQNDASGNADHIYIDQVIIKGIIGDGGDSASSINAVAGYTTFGNENSDFVGDEMLYPNPAKDILNINTNFGMIKPTYRITNLLGQVITSGTIENNSINISSLKKGVYLIELSDEEETFTQKFIKQ